MIEHNPADRIFASQVRAELVLIKNGLEPKPDIGYRPLPNQFSQLSPPLTSSPVLTSNGLIIQPQQPYLMTDASLSGQRLPSEISFCRIRDIHDEVVNVTSASFHPRDPVLACGLRSGKVLILHDPQSSNVGWKKAEPRLFCESKVAMLQWNVRD